MAANLGQQLWDIGDIVELIEEREPVGRDVTNFVRAAEEERLSIASIAAVPAK